MSATLFGHPCKKRIFLKTLLPSFSLCSCHSNTHKYTPLISRLITPLTHIDQELIDRPETDREEEGEAGGRPNEPDGGQMLNERKWRAKAEETSKIQGDAEGETRRGIGRSAGNRQEGGGMGGTDNVAGK